MQKTERKLILDIVRRWGGFATDAILDPYTLIFQIPEIEGLIGYKLSAGCAVVYGDPICDPTQSVELARAFHKWCKGHGWRIVYLPSSHEFATLAIREGLCKSSIEFGNELSLNPQDDPQKKTGNTASLLRRKVRQALNEDTIIHEYETNDDNLKKAIEEVGVSWITSRKGPQVHISNIYLFDDAVGKRWFYAKRADSIVGVAILNRLEKSEGWLLNHLMTTKEASNGTSELLVAKILETVAMENCQFITFGAIPAEKLGQITGLGRLSEGIARSAYNISSRIFHLTGIVKFWKKFAPTSKPVFLLFSDPYVGWREIAAIMKATNASIW